jgi:hypothetical protein
MDWAKFWAIFSKTHLVTLWRGSTIFPLSSNLRRNPKITSNVIDFLGIEQFFS